MTEDEKNRLAYLTRKINLSYLTNEEMGEHMDLSEKLKSNQIILPTSDMGIQLPPHKIPFEWEQIISDEIQRAKVIGGWIVMDASSSMIFIADPFHAWSIEK